MIKAAFSGGTLTSIFTTNVNTMVLVGYMQTGDTTAGWTRTVDVNDFKTNERPRLTTGPNLEKLPRGGEAKHAKRSDVGESYRIARYSEQWVIDETAPTAHVAVGQEGARVPDSGGELFHVLAEIYL